MNFFNQECRIVDLSLTIHEDLPVSWCGHHVYEHHSWKFFDSPDEPYATNYFCIDEHGATHCDAPPHFIPPPESGKELASEEGSLFGDSLSLPQMIGELVVMDVRSLQEGKQKNGVSPMISEAFVRNWEKENRDIIAGDIVVFRTDWDKYYVPGDTGKKYVQNPVADKTFPGWASPSLEALSYLYEKGVNCMGIDAASMGAVHGGVAQHQFSLAKKIIFVEGLANMKSVPFLGARFLFLPIKLGKSTGCIGRAVAFVKEPLS